MKFYAYPLALALLLGTGSGIAQDVAPDAVTQLIEQARFWEQRERFDLARESWERALAADSDNEEVLGRLALLLARSGETVRARELERRLRRVNPDAPMLQELAAERQRPDIERANTERRRLLDSARALAQQGEIPEALARYEEAFGGTQAPTQALESEYFEVMAGDSARYDEALKGLQALASRNPENAYYRLAHARAQTYAQRNRRAGIQSLHALRSDPRVSEEARAAHRQALIWLDARPSDIPLFDRYLDAHGSDADIRDKRRRLVAQIPDPAQQQRERAIESAFDALDAGRVAEAESRFNAILDQRPNASDALGGLGIVRLQQSRFAEAETLLDRAMRAQPATAARWREAYTNAAFFTHFDRAQTAMKTGDVDAALIHFRRAFDRAPADLDPALRISFANVLLQTQNFDDAERQIDQVLRAQPRNTDARVTLARIYAQTGRFEDAERLAKEGPPEVAAAMAPVRADLMRQRASASLAIGNSQLAKRQLREAIAFDPTSPWPRLDLARILRSEGDTEQATQLLDSLAQTHPDLVDVRVAQAFLLAEQQLWLDVMLELDTLPQRARSEEVTALQNRAWINYQVERAKIANANGDFPLAFATMTAADQATGNSTEYVSLLAGGWAELGDPARALGYLRRAFAAEPASNQERIQYAALLLELGQDAEFEAQAEYLLSQPLTATQSAQLEELVIAFRMRLADRAREKGQLAEAYDLLRDVVRRRPEDLDVQMTLARVFDSAGDHVQALAIYDSVLASEPDNIAAQDGRINALLGAGDTAVVAEAIADARRSRPKAAEIDLFAARLAEARGNEGQALRYYENAADKRNHRPASVRPAPPPELRPISGVERQAPLLPRPVQEAAGTRNPHAPESVLRPRPGSFSRPVPPKSDTSSLPDDRLDRTMAMQGSYVASAPVPAPQGELRLRSSSELHTAAPPRSSNTGSPRASGVASAAPHESQTQLHDSGTTRLTTTEAAVTPEANIARLRANTTGRAAGALHARSRDGESGLSRLFNLEIPLDFQSRQTSLGRFGVRIVPVLADAGNVSGPQLLRFGSLPLINGGSQDTISQDASGVAIGLTYAMGSFYADIGTTPLGFEVERVTGGIGWAPSFGDWRLAMDLSRRPVTDSLLSYAGTRDPLTGAAFGAINRTRGRADLTYDRGHFGIYGNLGVARYDGRNTDDNSAVELGAGAYFRAIRAPRIALTYGINITTFFYDNNRRFFTLGHGGYFSPQSFLSVGVPVELSGRIDNLIWRVGGAIGLQAFNEDGAPTFPNNANLQAQLEDLIAIDPDTDLVGGTPGGSQSGLGYSFNGSAEYRLNEQLFIGGLVGTDNARDFDEFILAGFLRFFFDAQPQLPEAPRTLDAHYNWSGR